MDICGYHLRCLNNGNSCLDCVHQYKNKNNDHLQDVLSIWPVGKEAGYATSSILLVEKSQ